MTDLQTNARQRAVAIAQSEGGEQETTSATTTRIVVDTSVLIADPHCFDTFGEVALIVPLTVVEELDSLKTRPDDVGRSARTALRTIEEYRVRHGGSLAEPVPAGDGTLQIEINGIQKHLLVEHGLDVNVPDNRIIGAALGQAGKGPTVMLSNDAALRIKAAHLGLSAAAHEPTKGVRSERPVGWVVIDVEHEIVDCLYAAGGVEIGAVEAADSLHDNEFAVLRSGSQSALTRRIDDELVLLPH